MPQQPLKGPAPQGRFSIDAEGRLLVDGQAPTPVEAPKVDLLTNPGDPTKNISVPQGTMDKKMLRTFGGGLSLASSLIPGGRGALIGAEIGGSALPALLRIAMGATGGAVSGAGNEEGANPVGGAEKETAYSLLGELGGYGVPYAGTALGAALGGVKDPTVAAKAVMNTRIRRSPTIGDWLPSISDIFTKRPSEWATAGIPLGAPSKVEGAIKEGNAALETAERASPVTGNGMDLMGAGQPALAQSKYTSRPMEKGEAIMADEKAFSDQLIQRFLGVPPAITANMTPQQRRLLLEKVQLSARDMGEFKRNLRDKNVMKAQREGAFIPAEDHSRDVVNQARSNQIGDTLKQKEAAIDPSMPIQSANEALTDLHTIDNANDQLRGGGKILSTPGQIGARGALGYATSRALASLFGIADPNVIGMLGGLGAIPALASRPLSGGSMILGRGMQLAPVIHRAVDIQKDEPKEPVRRKKPGGGK